MLVYGDADRLFSPRDGLAALAAQCRGLGGASWIIAHDALSAAFVDAAELAQGIVDARFAETGVDGPTPDGEAAIRLVRDLAAALDRSWRDGAIPDVDLQGGIAALHALPLPKTVTARRAEGYAFYAVYPEGFAVAARELPAGEGLTVVGIRSIGLGLAAVVSAASGADAPVTVRPGGHPFHRTLSLSPALEARLRVARRVAVVDEGPGLSGSSFGAVLDRLGALGIPEANIDVLPSHAGDLGAEASPPHRARWSRLSRHVAAFEPLIIGPAVPRQRLENWFTDITGKPSAPLEDLSGGLWRHRHYASEADWPAANVWKERRKYLLTAASGSWLLKFTGLGRYGRAKLGQAAALGAAGFITPPAGLRHGFLAEPWLGDARPLDRAGIDRDALLRHLGDYLGFRARHFPAEEGSGGSAQALADMLRRNAGLALGGEAAPEVESLCRHLPAVAAKLRRVVTDNRLHAWEWLQRGDGSLVKTDALDHAAAHDLVGSQDIAWDIAGAVAEFDLSRDEEAALARRVAAVSGEPVDPDVLRFMSAGYLAFQLGAATMARDSLSGAEAARLDREVRRYRARLVRELGRAA